MSEEKILFEEPNNEDTTEDRSDTTGEAVDESLSSDEKSLGPREFVRQLELYARVKAATQEDVENALVSNGVVKFEGFNIHHKLGRLGDTCTNEIEDALDKNYSVIEGRKNRMPEASYKKSLEIADAALRAEHAKRALLDTVENVALKGIDKDATESEINEVVGNKLFESLFNGVGIPEGLQYFESPLAITFAIPYEADRNKMLKLKQEIIAVHSEVTENEYEDFEDGEDSTADIGGSSYTKTLRFIDSESGETFNQRLNIVIMYSHGSSVENSVVLSAPLYQHEHQHVIDSVLREETGIDAARHEKWLGEDSHKTLAVDLNPLSWQLLKTEIFANHVYDPEAEKQIAVSGNSLFSTLSDENSSYNFEDVLNRTEPLEPNGDGFSESDHYKKIVLNADVALYRLREMYNLEFEDDPKKASRMAIAVLDQFPVFDWPRVYKIVKKYSMYDKARKAEEEFNNRFKDVEV